MPGMGAYSRPMLARKASMFKFADNYWINPANVASVQLRSNVESSRGVLSFQVEVVSDGGHRMFSPWMVEKEAQAKVEAILKAVKEAGNA